MIFPRLNDWLFKEPRNGLDCGSLVESCVVLSDGTRTEEKGCVALRTGGNELAGVLPLDGSERPFKNGLSDGGGGLG